MHMPVVHSHRRSLSCLIVGASLALGSHAATAQTSSDFFKNKNIGVNIGYGAGGGYDIYGRLLARHLGKHLAGNPTMVPKNMPGAGSLKAANYIYNTAPRDGTELGIVASSTLMEPLFGNKQALFDAAKFGWVGSMSQDVSFCSIRTDAGVSNLEDWLKNKRELTFGSTGPAATTYQHTQIVKKMLGVNARTVAGYTGATEVGLAIQRKEVDGICGLQITALQFGFQPMIDSGELKVLVQMGSFKTDVFGPVPSMEDYLKTDLDRSVYQLHFGSLKLARPVIAPPNIPAERLAELQRGFDAAMKDPELLADAEKAKIDINPVHGSEARDLLVRFAGYPRPVIDRAAENIR
jgi:tripartite-type tricarboxylate transporter receptor subunit TctC